ncbi:MAG: hypothetical protein NTU47_16105 [Ignavibacteriales bacterium]|nr:hypothetical protein [Ignavibacteriales bacterium]
MKTAVILVVGSLISFLTLLTAGLALRSAKPEWFGGAAKAQQPAATTTNAATRASRDSLLASGGADTSQTAAQDVKNDSSMARVDTMLVAKLSSKAMDLESQVDSLKRQLQGVKTKTDTTAQQDWKSTAKLIESMGAEEACKILKEMNDADVKQVLGKVKKRQAGKILAILDPVRAAKLLR